MQQKIMPCLWYDHEAEEAVQFYTSLFEDSRIVETVPSPEVGPGEPGTTMLVVFELAGQRYMALNGGPEFTFNEAVSLNIACESQEEIDRLWERLGEGGEYGPCGWLKDKYGLSWQVDSAELQQMFNDPDQDKVNRVMRAMLEMSKIDIARLREAAESPAVTG
ncbi:VOC family protein [Saccharopolyspora rectivirgula]|jgi:predicted 3-demethylubiquinone-9 3-methyltransferase (glyoxalase superfamily)|uniref:3-demethylubiquinone-9 3-methyltransferase n=2 Tax=Bacteria TaxID=2 RepID=A0A073AYA4_9PSEU|nr:VOC family protein [Saccharopolyspora rectivirgula]KEI44738.1 3-demethylubiquinone-9 3-methyltransferase [Saccharopolyspora rectivirgula]